MPVCITGRQVLSQWNVTPTTNWIIVLGGVSNTSVAVIELSKYAVNIPQPEISVKFRNLIMPTDTFRQCQ